MDRRQSACDSDGRLKEPDASRGWTASAHASAKFKHESAPAEVRYENPRVALMKQQDVRLAQAEKRKTVADTEAEDTGAKEVADNDDGVLEAGVDTI